MSFQQIRQSELFAGEDWTAIYRAFTQVNFQAYDFDTIRVALVDYIQRNYPEDFNDYIQSQQFIFQIDLVAYLGQSMSFRSDLNARENLLDTATRKQSILRLAKMLSYSPKRNYPARGLLKLTTIRTNESIQDSLGNNLSNREIRWNDPSNLDWYEQFIQVLNSSFIATNPFGKPVKQGTVGSIRTQLYRLNNQTMNSVAEPFSATVNGQGMQFEIVNPDFDNLGFFSEKTPNPLAGKNIIYRNDGAGNGSPNSGFFAYFKQGSIAFEDFNLQTPIENRTIDINTANINELDVWVQEINNNGLVVTDWIKVPTTETIAFNSLSRQERNIYSVLTRDNDQISIRFGDGRLANAPAGLFRVWYRTSNGLRYQIQSNDLTGVQIVIPYLKNTSSGQTLTYELTLTFSLQYAIGDTTVGGSLPSETLDQIKQRAPQTYYTQNRMVNGEDYNLFPLMNGNTIRKVKATNRIYSGQSRYIDFQDPTGRYQNTNTFGDEGILYREAFNRADYETLPTIKTPRQMIDAHIQPLLEEIDLRDFMTANYPRHSIYSNPYKTKWLQKSAATYSSTGEFAADIANNSVYVPQPIGLGSTNNYVYLSEGSLVKFQHPTDATQTKWAKIQSVAGAGVDPLFSSASTGPVVLSEDIEDGWHVMEVISAFREVLTSTELNLIEAPIESELTFALRYDALYSQWVIITTNNIGMGAFSLTNAGDNSQTNIDTSWLLLAEYLPGSGYWRFTTRNLRYVFESETDNRFFFVDNTLVVDAQRALAQRDFIRVLKFNAQPSPSNQPLGASYDWLLVKPIVYADGYIEPRRVQISFADRDGDGVIDDPDQFDVIVDPLATEVGSTLKDRYVFHILVTQNGYDYFVPTTSVKAFNNAGEVSSINFLVGDEGYLVDSASFITRAADLSIQPITDGHLQAALGRRILNYQWKHFAPIDHRIDPAKTNVIDTIVLTESYYQTVQTWVNSLNRSTFPVPPTSDDLQLQFSDLDQFKMISDELVWHPARYKLLFGEGALDELRAQFKVIKTANTPLTDNEIKQQTISAINDFFNVDNWGFGESFYASELSAYIHQRLATHVASVVIVPQKASSHFGDLYQIRSESDQLFLSTASVNDVIIVNAYTTGNIRIGN